MGTRFRRAAFLAALLTGCTSAPVTAGSTDGGTSTDAGTSPAVDAGSPASDAGATPTDGGTTGDQSVSCSPTCTPNTGLCGPLQVCSPTAPCQDLGGKQVPTEITLPTCATKDAQRTSFNDGPPGTWTDAVNGDQRAACEFVPPGASSSTPLPLVVFLHGSHGSADDIYNTMSLRAKAASFDLKGDGTNAGFVLASMQGRNLHWEGMNPAGSHHDYLFRDLASPSANPDVRALDKLIDELVASGKADPKRIYVMGWSNGAFMSELYGIARFTTATPGGNHVAAVVSYAGADPFNTPDPAQPECQLAHYPMSNVPMFVIHRACDALVPCSAEQEMKFSVPPGYTVEEWLKVAASSSGVGDTALSDTIVDYKGVAVGACTGASLCTLVTGTENHLRWPDGVADGGGHDWEPAMLGFLRDHPHP